METRRARAGKGQRVRRPQLGQVAAAVRVMVLAGLVLAVARSASAAHDTTNTLVFAPVTGSPSPAATGDGVVEFRGGPEPRSRWSARFGFRGLQPDTDYAVVVQGRFGEDGSPAAEAFTPLCAFRTDPTGAGTCWWYHLGLRRLSVVQVRLGDAAGAPVLQATRAPGGPGTITSRPNPFSPPASPGIATPLPGTPPPASATG
ncbi:MAG: hypothetical protein AVDCRST_MAG49-3339 [uncultured Thermomicrobiales bacterium]|uniref:Uncharacterized protein n=1 Tax=uncultured Thermomicrobiales bacterium TaxID=1645740 RepID=A0A6J4V8N4_9BACT|nr:MAG: hypothetical protein AVDCRST_MAG49-3339 [uncultured Thermomicrobiales bacterium]